MQQSQQSCTICSDAQRQEQLMNRHQSIKAVSQLTDALSQQAFAICTAKFAGLWETVLLSL